MKTGKLDNTKFQNGVFKDKNLTGPRALHQSGNTLYAAGWDSNTIVAIDMKTGKLDNTKFQNGVFKDENLKTPRALHQTGNTLYAAGYNSNTIVAIDMKTGKLDNTKFQNGVFKDENLKTPYALHQSGNTLYAAGWDSDTIVAIDMKTGKLVTEPVKVMIQEFAAGTPQETSSIDYFESGDVVDWTRWRKIPDSDIIVHTMVAGLAAKRGPNGKFNVFGGGLPAWQIPVTMDTFKTTEAIGLLMSRMETHIALAPEGDIDLKRVVIIMNKELPEDATRGDAVFNQTLKQRYRVMVQNLRKVFSSGKDMDGLVEVSSRDELIQKTNALIKSGYKAIVLDNGSLTSNLAPGVIQGAAGESYCVISSDRAVACAEGEFAFVNINAMAMAGVGIVYDDSILFKTAYKIFTGTDASETLLSALANKILWIVNVLPRVVKFTNELNQNEEARRLFAVSA